MSKRAEVYQPTNLGPENSETISGTDKDIIFKSIFKSKQSKQDEQVSTKDVEIIYNNDVESNHNHNHNHNNSKSKLSQPILPKPCFGYVSKEGHIVKNFKVRYFVLLAEANAPSILKYYEEPMEKVEKPILTIAWLPLTFVNIC